MGIKLIASDFDGTVGTGEQLKRDAEAINKFREQGNLFGFVSGRNSAALRYVQEKAGISVDFLLPNSGGSCFVGEKLISCAMADEKVFFPLTCFLMSKGTRLLSANRPDGADMLFYKHRDGSEEVAPPELWASRPFPQMCGLFENSGESRRIAEELNAIFPRLSALPNGACLDIIPKGSGKAVGVKQVAALFGVNQQDIFTVGDNFNDLPMLDAYNSFVVENAPDEVKRHASVAVVPSISQMIDYLSHN